MTRNRFIAMLLLVGGLALVPSVPAAATGAVVSISNTVLYPDCNQHPYTYSVDVLPGQPWTLDIDIKKPTGAYFVSEFEFGNGPSTATVDVLICSFDLPGTYATDWTLTVSGDPSQTITITGADTFAIRAAKTKTSLDVSDLHPAIGQVLKFTIKSKVETLKGYFGTSYAKVVLERKFKGAWHLLPDGKTTTNDSGKAVLKYRWTKDSTLAVVRARTLAHEDDRKGSESQKSTIDGD